MMTIENDFKKTSKAPFYDWLLLFTCVMLFVIVPLLFAWSSMSMIHNRVPGPVFVLTKTIHVGPVTPVFRSTQVEHAEKA